MTAFSGIKWLYCLCIFCVVTVSVNLWRIILLTHHLGDSFLHLFLSIQSSSFDNRNWIIPFAHPLLSIQSPIHPSIESTIHPAIYSLIHPSILPYNHPFIDWFINKSIHPFSYPSRLLPQPCMLQYCPSVSLTIVFSFSPPSTFTTNFSTHINPSSNIAPPCVICSILGETRQVKDSLVYTHILL